MIALLATNIITMSNSFKETMLVEMRNIIIHATEELGLSGSDIAKVLSLDKSTVSRVLARKSEVDSRQIEEFVNLIKKLN